MGKDILTQEEHSLLKVIVANPGSAEAAAALAELEIRSRKASEGINRRMLLLTIVLALAAIGQVSTDLMALAFSNRNDPVCECNSTPGGLDARATKKTTVPGISRNPK